MWRLYLLQMLRHHRLRRNLGQHLILSRHLILVMDWCLECFHFLRFQLLNHRRHHRHQNRQQQRQGYCYYRRRDRHQLK